MRKYLKESFQNIFYEGSPKRSFICQESPFYDDIYRTFISVISQLDAQNFCFTMSLIYASTCFEHMCSKHVEA